MSSSDLPAGSPPAPRLARLPGLRTLASARFRMLLAGCLLVIGVGLLGALLIAQARQPLEQGQFGIDFADYQRAAQRLRGGASPYAPEMFQGPVPAQGLDRYRYPPVFAQLLAPLAPLPLALAATIWLAVQALLTYLAVWIAGSVGGLRGGLERALWTGVAVTYFLPVFDSLWKGNVSGVVAFQVALLALGGAVGGISLASAVLLKVSPLTLVPVAAVGERRALLGLLAGSAAIAIPSLLLSPGAWRDYATVLPNLLSGSADYATNSAPHVLLPNVVPALAPLSGLVRLATLALGGGLVLASVWLARRPRGWHAAIVAGSAAMLLLPAAIWLHYLVVLLPLAALGWSQAGSRTRTCLVIGGVGVSFAIAWLPLALLGGGVMVAAALVALWPRAD